MVTLTHLARIRWCLRPSMWPRTGGQSKTRQPTGDSEKIMGLGSHLTAMSLKSGGQNCALGLTNETGNFLKPISRR